MCDIHVYIYQCSVMCIVICNCTGGNTKHIFIADPREHRFLVNEANRPGAIANMLGLVLRMLPGFHETK